MPVVGKRFRDALVWAAELHEDQKRKGGDIPYVSHLLGVASIVLEHGGDEDQAIAGLLYNVIRDCGPTHAQQISDAFGPTVADIVVECSDGAAEDTSGTGAGWQQLLDWQRRKLAHLAHLATATDATLLVSGCSKLCNARAIVGDLDDPRVGKTVFARFKSGLDGTLAYYHSLSQVFIKRGSPVARQLDAVVVRMHVLAGVGERRGLEMN